MPPPNHRTTPQLLAPPQITKLQKHIAAPLSPHLPLQPANKAYRSPHTGQNTRFKLKLHRHNGNTQEEPVLDQQLGQDVPLR